VERILIAPWGVPERWEKVNYVIEGHEESSRSSIKPLVSKLHPNRVILVVVDTAIGEEFEDYEDLCRKVEEYYKKFCEEIQLPLTPEVIVAPGVGDFEKAKFEGEMTDFYHFASFELAKRLISAKGELDLILDLTHGVNFAPTLLYRSLHELLGVLAYTRKVQLRVYNAEPYRKGVKTLQIHLVESRGVQPRLSAHLLGEEDGRAYLVKPVRKPPQGESMRAVRIEAKETSELNAFLSSIANGLPLALLTFYPGKELEEKLKEACDLWRRSVECLKEEKIVRRRMRFTDDFMRCVRLWVAARSFGLGRREEASLEELKELSKLFKSEGMKEALVSRTLAGLETRIGGSKKGIGEWTPLSELMEEGKSGGFSPQNFLAHAGLEYNVTEVRISGGVRLRYPESQRGKVLEACHQGLFKPQRRAG
jgi:CRISPR-associated protein Csx1